MVTVNLWNRLDGETKNCLTIESFKYKHMRKLSLPIIPIIQKYLLKGDRRTNLIYARFRCNCGDLKYDLFLVNILPNSRCSCGCFREDAPYYFFHCRLSSEQSRDLSNFLVQHNIRNDWYQHPIAWWSIIDEAAHKLLVSAVMSFIRNSRRFTEGT